MVRKGNRERRLTVRLAGPLFDQLETAATREGRTLAGQVRQILIDHVAHRVVATAQPKELHQ